MLCSAGVLSPPRDCRPYLRLAERVVNILCRARLGRAVMAVERREMAKTEHSTDRTRLPPA